MKINTEKLLSCLDDAALAAKGDAVLRELALVNESLGRARSQLAKDGKHSDIDWYRRAETARRMMGREHQIILRIISERNKAKKAQERRELGAAFMDVARDRLPKETFHEILSMSLVRAGQ